MDLKKKIEFKNAPKHSIITYVNKSVDPSQNKKLKGKKE